MIFFRVGPSRCSAIKTDMGLQYIIAWSCGPPRPPRSLPWPVLHSLHIHHNHWLHTLRWLFVFGSIYARHVPWRCLLWRMNTISRGRGLKTFPQFYPSHLRYQNNPDKKTVYSTVDGISRSVYTLLNDRKFPYRCVYTIP